MYVYYLVRNVIGLSEKEKFFFIFFRKVIDPKLYFQIEYLLFSCELIIINYLGTIKSYVNHVHITKFSVILGLFF